MKDLKEKIKRKINEMLDAEGLTAEELNYLTDAYCHIAADERMKSMHALAGLASTAAFAQNLRPDGVDPEMEEHYDPTETF